jgi:subtilisin family serine protease
MASMKPLVLRVCVQATDLSTGTGAGVRKPPKNETAGRHPADQRSGLETFPTFGTVFDGRPPLDFGCSCMDRQDARARRHAEQLTVGDDRPGHLGAVLVRVVAVADGIELAGDGAAEVGMGGVDLPEAQSGAQTTTQHILAGIDWAIAKGARIINMSFAGPYDPLLSQALKKAHEKGIVLIAAAGNAGPQSPPLYPAADENVIAVVKLAGA